MRKPEAVQLSVRPDFVRPARTVRERDILKVEVVYYVALFANILVARTHRPAVSCSVRRFRYAPRPDFGILGDVYRFPGAVSTPSGGS